MSDTVGDRYALRLLKMLEDWIAPELTSSDAQAQYELVRRSLARLALQPREYDNLAETSASGAPVRSRQEEFESIDRGEAHLQALLSRQSRSNSAAAPSLSGAQIEGWLREHGEPDAVVKSFRPLAGGRSKQTILVELEAVRNLPRQVIIRRDGNLVTGTTVADEYALLIALSDRGLAVPRPYRLVTDPSLHTPLMFMQRVSGKVFGDVFTPPENSAHIIGLARMFGKMAGIPADDIVRHMNPTTQRKTIDFYLSEVADFHRDWAENGRTASPTVEYALRWLTDNAHRLSPQTGLVHGDPSFHNVLFEGDRLAAFLDWEVSTIGHPAEDLGSVKTCVSRGFAWGDFMAAYRDAGGYELDPAEVDWFALYTSLWNIRLLHHCRTAFENGITDDPGIMEATLSYLPRFMQRLSLAVRAVSEG